jgi:chromosome partitioning protein
VNRHARRAHECVTLAAMDPTSTATGRAGTPGPRRVVVLNPKGGSGKTTLATNLAAYFARAGGRPALIDYDPQGSSTHWLAARPATAPAIHGIAAYERRMDVTRSFQLRVPDDCGYVIVDSPAAYNAAQLRELTRDADKVLMPVLPSRFDIHAASRAIADMLLVAKLDRRRGQIGIVANRTRRNTRVFETLMRFLDTLEIPVVAVLRDAQVYVRASEQGLGLYDLKPYVYAREAPGWQSLTEFVTTDGPWKPASSDGADETGVCVDTLENDRRGGVLDARQVQDFALDKRAERTQVRGHDAQHEID